MISPAENSFNAFSLEQGLETRLVGKTVLVYDEVDSTNDLLKPILAHPQYNGLAVFARFQRGGKGREGRTWTAKPDSSILCSVLVQLAGRPSELSGPITLACATATAHSVARTFHLPVKIKWPNDIYLAGRKLAGILIESSQIQPHTTGFIIGIGINITQQPEDFYPPELRQKAISIAQGLNRPVDESERTLLARELLRQLDEGIAHLCEKKYSLLRHDWLTLAGGADHPVIVTRHNETFHARIIDIDHRDNSLLVQNPDGLILQLHQNTCKVIG